MLHSACRGADLRERFRLAGSLRSGFEPTRNDPAPISVRGDQRDTDEHGHGDKRLAGPSHLKKKDRNDDKNQKRFGWLRPLCDTPFPANNNRCDRAKQNADRSVS
jgi:hypothetical protein